MNTLPQHVAIIMDGNRRWAKQHHLPVVAGHRKVVEERIEELIDHAGHLGIHYITFWAFSTENWDRSQDEVGGIMSLFRLALKKYAERLIKKGARLNVIGDMSKFDKDIREGFAGFMEKSKGNTGITATFALNYGGRDEVIRAIRKMREDRLEDGKIGRLEVCEECFEKYLDTAGMPDPDLVIRTSGEQRLSGFMPWQSVYSEFIFPQVLMPDFGAEEFDKAMEEYGRRERRRGK